MTLLFAAAAVMTAIDDMKKIGYSAGIVGLVAMVALRWERRRKERDNAARNAA